MEDEVQSASLDESSFTMPEMAAAAQGAWQSSVAAVVSLFESGSRHQQEKLLVVALWMIVVGASFAVGLTQPKSKDNPLGADYAYELIEPIDRRILFLSNESEIEWTDITITLNNSYLHSISALRAGGRIDLRPQEKFSYFYYVPRQWGREEWELLAANRPQPGSKAPANLTVRELKVQATQGVWTTQVTD
jgi:hypothetical protein